MSVDELSQEFMKVLLEYGGDADTTTIRSETGMSRGQINHRYKKLDNLDWIEIDRASSGAGERTPPKIARITEEGMQAIRSGEAGPKVLGKEINDEEETLELTRDQLDSFYQEIEGMKNQLNVIVEQVNDKPTSNNDNNENNTNYSSVDEERIAQLEQEVNRLSKTVKLLNKTVSKQQKNESKKYDDILDKIENGDNDIGADEELVKELQEKQESIDSWKSVAEIYLKGMTLYLRDEGVDLNEYFSKAEKKIE